MAASKTELVRELEELRTGGVTGDKLRNGLYDTLVSLRYGERE